MKGLNLGLAFLLELCLLVALAYWGYRLDMDTAVRWFAAVGAPLALVATWGVIAAPNTRRRLPPTPLVGFKLLVFTLGAVLLYTTGRHALTLLLEAATVVNLGLSVVWDQ